MSPDLGRLVYDEVRKAIVRGTVGSRPRSQVIATAAVDVATTSGDESGVGTVTTFAALPDPAGEEEVPRSPTSASAARTAAVRLQALDDAYESQTLYLVGKEQLRVTQKKGIAGLVQRAALSFFLFVRENTRQKVAQLDVPVEKLVEVGFVGMI